MSSWLQWCSAPLNKLSSPGSRCGPSLWAGLAHPMVLVNTRARKGETWSVGLKCLLPMELGAWSRKSSSREVRRKSVPGKSLPLGVVDPGLRCAGGKLVELRRKDRIRDRTETNRTTCSADFCDSHINWHVFVRGVIKEIFKVYNYAFCNNKNWRLTLYFQKG